MTKKKLEGEIRTLNLIIKNDTKDLKAKDKKIKELEDNMNFNSRQIDDMIRKHTKRIRQLQDKIKEMKSDINWYEGFIEKEKLEEKYQKYIDKIMDD